MVYRNEFRFNLAKWTNLWNAYHNKENPQCNKTSIVLKGSMYSTRATVHTLRLWSFGDFYNTNQFLRAFFPKTDLHQNNRGCLGTESSISDMDVHCMFDLLSLCNHDHHPTYNTLKHINGYVIMLISTSVICGHMWYLNLEFRWKHENRKENIVPIFKMYYNGTQFITKHRILSDIDDLYYLYYIPNATT